MLPVTTDPEQRGFCLAPAQAADSCRLAHSRLSHKSTTARRPVGVSAKPVAALRGGSDQWAGGRRGRRGRMARLCIRTEKKTFVCSWEGCGRAFGQSGRLTRHWRVHTGEKPFVCPWEGCGRAFSQLPNLTPHLRIHSRERPFCCPQEGCGSRFVQLVHLRWHLSVHSGDKPFACFHEGCGRAFAHPANLTQHLSTHSRSSKKYLVCPYEDCGHAYALPGSLKSHKRRRHAGGKRFVCSCDGCEYACEQSNHLKKYKHRYTGEKPFCCPWEGCGYSCAQSSDLKKHERCHTGERPFACPRDGCGRAFVQSTHLKRHLRVHIKNTPHASRQGGRADTSMPSGVSCGQPSARRDSALGSCALAADKRRPVNQQHPSPTAAAACSGVRAGTAPVPVRDRGLQIVPRLSGGSAPAPDGEENIFPGPGMSPSPASPAAAVAELESMLAPDVFLSGWPTGFASESPPWLPGFLDTADARAPDAAALALPDDDRAFWQALLSSTATETLRSAP